MRLLPVWLLARGGSCRLSGDFGESRADIRQGASQALAAGGTDPGRIMSFRHHAPGYARDAFQAFCPSGLAGARLRRHSLLRGVRICRCATFQRRGLWSTRSSRIFGCALFSVSPRGCLGTRGVGRSEFLWTGSVYQIGTENPGQSECARGAVGVDLAYFFGVAGHLFLFFCAKVGSADGDCSKFGLN